MKQHLRQSLPILLLVMHAIGQCADSSSSGVGATMFFSNDSESFKTQRYGLEYLARYQNADSLTGVRYTNHYFEQNNWSRNAQQLSLLHRNIDPATAYGWQVDAGVSEQAGHDLLTLDANYRLPLAKNASLELFVNRDWVETTGALDHAINFTYAGASVEYVPNPHVTLVALGGYQGFSDGNHRTHGRFRVVYQPNLDLGLTLQAQYRIYTSGTSDIAGAYFNPDRYAEGLFLIGWRQKINGWMANARAGIGRQKVANDDLTPSKLVELGLQSPVRQNYSLRLRAGYNQSSSFMGPNYQYRYVQGEVIIPF